MARAGASSPASRCRGAATWTSSARPAGASASGTRLALCCAAFPLGSARRSAAARCSPPTSNHYYTLRGVRPGTRLAKVARRLHAGRPFATGLNLWYLLPDGPSRGVLKVRHGVIEEIGIANPQLTRTRRAARVFFASFS